jgi:hypothetical protein
MSVFTEVLDTNEQFFAVSMFGESITDPIPYLKLFSPAVTPEAFYAMVGKLTHRTLRGPGMNRTDCELYLAGKPTKDGYSVVCLRRYGQIPAHRAAFMLYYCTKLGSTTVDHLCRNHRCIAKAHLFPRSRLEHGKITRSREHEIDPYIRRWLDTRVRLEPRAWESSAALLRSWVSFHPASCADSLFFQRLRRLALQRGHDLRRSRPGPRTHRQHGYWGIMLLDPPYDPGADAAAIAERAMIRQLMTER